MTAWLYEYAKKRMSKHSRIYSSYQMDVGSAAFKRAFVAASECSNNRFKENNQNEWLLKGEKEKKC